MTVFFLLSQTGNQSSLVAGSLSKTGRSPSPAGIGHRGRALQDEERRLPLSRTTRPRAEQIHTQGQVKRAKRGLHIPARSCGGKAGSRGNGTGRRKASEGSNLENLGVEEE